MAGGDMMAQFQQLLVNMLNPDNETRSAAEKAYEKVALPQRASCLFQAFQSSDVVQNELRSLCLVLLRRLLANDWDDVWQSFPVESQSAFKQQLLHSAQTELDRNIRKKVADVIAEVARNHIDDQAIQQWTEVVPFLQQCGDAPDDGLKEAALLVFESVPGIYGAQQGSCLPAIRRLLEAGLRCERSSDVRTAAVRALTAFLCDNEDDAQTLRHFQDLVPAVVRICEAVVAQAEDDDIPLQCLGDMATSTPKLIRPYLNDVCSFCLKTVADKELEDGFRHSALEVLVSLCESSPAMMRKAGVAFIPQIVNQCLMLMVDMDDDDEEWHNADSIEDDDDETNATVGETSLDRVAVALGGKSVLPACIQAIPQMLTNEDWKYRHGALMAISTIGEGCHKTMESQIEKWVESMLPYLGDTHARVRYAACNAFGQMASDFTPTLQKKCHATLVDRLLAVIGDLQNPRVAAHAGAALVNFCEDCPKSILTGHLDAIMARLYEVLGQTFKALVEGGKKLVLEQIITTIASVADTAEERFVNYYDNVMPQLKYIMQNASGAELRLLRGKTIECVSLIGLAVGKDKFMADAEEIMQVLLASQAQFEQMEADDPQVSYMISAWARICKLLGPAFAPYLPMVMPAVMRSASFKPEIALLDEDETSAMDDADWQFVKLQDQQNFGIRTAGLEEKANACEMLVCYARELKEAFVDYVEPVVQLMLPLLKFYFHEGVRTAAAESLPHLLQCAGARGADFVSQTWLVVWPALTDAVGVEPETDVCAELLHALAKCIEFMGPPALDEQRFSQLSSIVEKQLESHFERAEERNKRRKDVDHDDDQEQELLNEAEEDAVLGRIADVFHALFGVYRDAVIPFFERLLPQFQKLVDERRPYTDRQWAICIFDDVIEFGGPASAKFQPTLVPPMLKALHDAAPEVRQAAAYGFGVMAMHGGNAYAQCCAQAIEPLVHMFVQTEARADSASTSATENAVSAVAKILKYNASMVDAAPVIPSFVAALPVSVDKEESPHTFGYFCDLIESNNPVALGADNANLPRVVQIIADAFRLDAFDSDGKETKQRLCNIVRQIETNETVFSACVGALTADQQLALHQALIEST